ncbi:uncharacterized protein Dvar_72240 [Desulfosarcina variabilis str. Montpellier]
MGRVKPAVLSFIALIFLTTIASGAVSKKNEAEVITKVNRIKIPFVENKGQLEDSKTLFYSNTFIGRVSVNKDASIGYELGTSSGDKEKQHHSIREKLGGALKPLPSGEQKAFAKVSHFRGKDPAKWGRDLSTFNTVDMGEIYKGIRLNLQAHGNNVEKIFHVQPGADPQSIQLTVEGADALQLTPQGELEVTAGTRSMRFTRPVAYQHIEGKKKPVDVAYAVSKKSYGFQVAAYDRTKELIIDPLITAVFQGTTDECTMPKCMAADSQGNIYVAGHSAKQLVVFKFDSRLETLLGSALFSDSGTWSRDGNPSVYDIAIDSQDAVYLVGGTEDENFPVTEGSFDTALQRGDDYYFDADGFIIKYNADLNTILASTFIGEDGGDVAFGLAIDANDDVYVVGGTKNPVNSASAAEDDTPFPTTPGAYDTSPGQYCKTKAFIARLDSGLQTLQASTLLGSNGEENGNDWYVNDSAFDVVIDADGNIVVAGRTRSADFPVTDNCADASFQGESEAFAAKFDPNLQQLLASTFLGGANEEKANVLAIDANNEIVVAGWTKSSDFPVVQGNYDTSYSVYEDGFVSRLNSDLTAISASTFIGGSGTDQVSDMVIQDDGTVFLCGGTGSSDFPVTEDCHDGAFNGGNTDDFYEGDGFLTIMDQALTTLIGSTYLGGNSHDHAAAILANNDDILVAGETWSSDFPYMIETIGITTSDAFVCRFNADETPETLPSAGPGYWLSHETGSADSIHLDVNICDDGTFSGQWRMYYCISSTICSIADEFQPNPVSGTIDFDNSKGTIDIGDDCTNVPFVIFKQNEERLVLHINPGGTDSSCTVEDFWSELDYQGECEAGTCENDDVDDDDDNDNDNDDNDDGGGDGGGGGGGSGGCFISALF